MGNLEIKNIECIVLMIFIIFAFVIELWSRLVTDLRYIICKKDCANCKCWSCKRYGIKTHRRVFRYMKKKLCLCQLCDDVEDCPCNKDYLNCETNKQLIEDVENLLLDLYM